MHHCTVGRTWQMNGGAKTHNGMAPMRCRDGRDLLCLKTAAKQQTNNNEP